MIIVRKSWGLGKLYQGIKNEDLVRFYTNLVAQYFFTSHGYKTLITSSAIPNRNYHNDNGATNLQYYHPLLIARRRQSRSGVGNRVACNGTLFISPLPIPYRQHWFQLDNLDDTTAKSSPSKVYSFSSNMDFNWDLFCNRFAKDEIFQVRSFLKLNLVLWCKVVNLSPEAAFTLLLWQLLFPNVYKHYEVFGPSTPLLCTLFFDTVDYLRLF